MTRYQVWYCRMIAIQPFVIYSSSVSSVRQTLLLAAIRKPVYFLGLLAL